MDIIKHKNRIIKNIVFVISFIIIFLNLYFYINIIHHDTKIHINKNVCHTCEFINKISNNVSNTLIGLNFIKTFYMIFMYFIIIKYFILFLQNKTLVGLNVRMDD